MEISKRTNDIGGYLFGGLAGGIIGYSMSIIREDFWEGIFVLITGIILFLLIFELVNRIPRGILLEYIKKKR